MKFSFKTLPICLLLCACSDGSRNERDCLLVTFAHYCARFKQTGKSDGKEIEVYSVNRRLQNCVLK